MAELFEIETCFSPALIPAYNPEGKTVILIDILRASSSICTAFYQGVKEIIPVASESEAQEYKRKGYIVAGERDGQVLAFADFGNSPFNFMSDDIKGKTIAYCTTNGTRAVKSVESAKTLYIGAYVNFSVLAEAVSRSDNDVFLYCSGWKNKFNLEDTLFAGAMAEKLIAGRRFTTHCDATIAAIDLWKMAKTDLLGYIQKAAHRERLRKLKLDDVLEYCHTFDKAPVVPLVRNGIISVANLLS